MVIERHVVGVQLFAKNHLEGWLAMKEITPKEAKIRKNLKKSFTFN